MLGRASGVKMVGMADMGAPISLDGWQSIWIVDVSAYSVIFILHQKIQKMAKCTFWYQLTRVVPDKVQRAVKWLCVNIQCNATILMSHINSHRCQNSNHYFGRRKNAIISKISALNLVSYRKIYH